MKATVAVISRDKNFCDYVQQQQRRVLPEDSLKKICEPKGLDITVMAIHDDGAIQKLDLEKRLDRASSGSQLFLMLVERCSQQMISSFSAGPLVQIFEGLPSYNGFQNFCHQLFSKLIKAYKYICSVEEKNIIRLPLRNFDAPDLRELAIICKEKVGQAAFFNEFEAQMKLLRKRYQPRRKSSRDESRYMFDNRRRHFQYGKERHARFPTAHPHLPSCNITGCFRFGCAVEVDRHFNVSMGEGDRTEISGQFLDCHDEKVDASKSSHLNMFCNDYF